MEQPSINNIKSELLEDLMATAKIKEEIWQYHPKNPNKTNIVEAYDLLTKMEKDITDELDKL